MNTTQNLTTGNKTLLRLLLLSSSTSSITISVTRRTYRKQKTYKRALRIYASLGQLLTVAVCLTEDIEPITETGKNDDVTASVGGDDALSAGEFAVRCASFSSAVTRALADQPLSFTECLDTDKVQELIRR